MDALRQEKRYTYADYATWDDGVRYELIDGVPYVDGKPFTGVPNQKKMMSPAPRRRHQELSGKLYSQLAAFLKGKPCRVYAAPFDVRLSGESGGDTVVVQPDIVVVCDREKLDDIGCNGAPDLIIEILSPSTARYDRLVKFGLYLRAGVREYWIADPDAKMVHTHILKDGAYFTSAYGDTDDAPVHVLEGCIIPLAEVFADDEF